MTDRGGGFFEEYNLITADTASHLYALEGAKEIYGFKLCILEHILAKIW